MSNDRSYLTALQDYYARHHALPSYASIGNLLGLRSKSSVAALVARLKLAGLDEAPAQLAVFADRSTMQGHGLGRHTMPEMIEYSAVTAVHTIWLAARSDGIGVGWVSILEPAAVGTILEVPQDWKFIAYLCLGFAQSEDDSPDLARKGWEKRQPFPVVLRR